MAVFPDRIVLKNSTDAQAAIETAIGSGGSDAIVQGEVVVGLEANAATFYTLDGSGNVVTIGSAAGAIANLGDLVDVDLSTPATDGQVIAYNSTSGNWEPVDQSGGLQNVVDDTTPQLGGHLDTNTHYITSASGNLNLEPATGEAVIRGGTSEGKLTLNCTANTHGVSIQSPPHADAATYTLVLPSSAGTAGQVLTSQGGAQLTWEDAGSGGATSINDLTDVDTNTTPPTQDQVLVWDGTSWVPGDQTGGSGGGGSSTVVAAFAFGYINATGAGSGTGVSWGTYDAGTGNIDVTFDTAQADTSYIVVTDNESADDIGASVSNKTTTGFRLSLYDFSSGNPSSPAAYPLTFQVFTSSGTQQVAGSGGGSGAGIYLTESQTASGGTADFVGLGYSGILQKVTSDLDAWIVLYSSAAERTADASRAYSTDPTPGSGVLFEAYVTAGSTVVATPGTTYLNNDTTLTEAVYAAVRDQAGTAVNASVTFSAYGLAAITAINGGTFGSGV